MKHIALSLLMLAWGVAAQAQEFSPPEGAQLVGSPARVTLRWPSLGAVELDVYQGNTVIYAENVKGDSQAVDLPGSGPFRWSVSRIRHRKVPEKRLSSSEYHHFSISNRLEYRFQAALGAPGASVQLNLEPAGDFIRVRWGSGMPQEFLLLPSSQPLDLWAVGGAGLPGQPGAAGREATAEAGPGAGGEGGPGSPGGKGGTITVSSSGVETERYFRFHVEGGEAGRGGPGGPGGQPAQGLNLPIQSQFPGHSGSPGPDGPTGPPGEVIKR